MSLVVDSTQGIDTSQINSLIDQILEGSSPTDSEFVRVVNEPEILPGNPVFLIVGPSGIGKTTFAKHLMDIGAAQKVRTATTRARKIERDESETAYKWLEGNVYNSDGEFVRKKSEEELIREYGLLECQEYAGFYYGLPKASLDQAVNSGPSIVVCENKGAKAITEYLRGKSTVVLVQLLPEKIEDLFVRMTGRDNFAGRVNRVIEEFSDLSGYVNFSIINKSVSQELAENYHIPALEGLVHLVNRIIIECQNCTNNEFRLEIL